MVVTIDGMELCPGGMRFSFAVLGERPSKCDWAGDSTKPSSPDPVEVASSGGGVGVLGGRGMGLLDAIVGDMVIEVLSCFARRRIILGQDRPQVQVAQKCW